MSETPNSNNIDLEGKPLADHITAVKEMIDVITVQVGNGMATEAEASDFTFSLMAMFSLMNLKWLGACRRRREAQEVNRQEFDAAVADAKAQGYTPRRSQVFLDNSFVMLAEHSAKAEYLLYARCPGITRTRDTIIGEATANTIYAYIVSTVRIPHDPDHDGAVRFPVLLSGVVPNGGEVEADVSILADDEEEALEKAKAIKPELVEWRGFDSRNDWLSRDEIRNVKITGAQIRD